VEFEWNEAKRLSNIEKHNLDFLDALTVCKGDILVQPAKPVGQEIRHAITGQLNDMIVTTIITLRGENLRVISMRRARDNERAGYQALYGG